MPRGRRRWRRWSRPAPARSSCTRTGAPRRPRSTAASAVADDYDVQVMIHTDTLNESRLRRGHHQGVQGPHHPRLPHRRRGRRACARHHQGGGAQERAAVVDQSDAAVHQEHHRRASRHADGVPPPRSVDRRGPGVCRKPHPQGDHRGGRHPARHRRAVDDVVGLAGHGPASARSSSAPGRPPTR